MGTSSSSNRITVNDASMWLKCAGSLPFKPQVNALVYYFAQGHSEHCGNSREFDSSFTESDKVAILCEIRSISYLADAVTQEMLAEIILQPIPAPEVIAPFDLPIEGVEDGFFSRTLCQTHIEQRLQLSYKTHGVFPPTTPSTSLSLVDIANKPYAMKLLPNTKDSLYLTGGFKEMCQEKKLKEGDTLFFKKSEEDERAVCFSFHRIDNPAALAFTESKESRKELRKAIKKASEGKEFTVTFFPGCVDFLVDPFFLAQCNERLGVKDMKVKKRNSKAQKGTLKNPVDPDKFAWKKVQVRMNKDGGVIFLNSWDIEPI